MKGPTGRCCAVVLSIGLGFFSRELPASSLPLSSGPTPADFEATIAALDKPNRTRPATLAARLEYADFLVQQGPDPCAPRFDLAQSLVNAVTQNPVTEVIFPQGWAHPTELLYRIHRGRAACNADPAARARELSAALDAAQLAQQQYREALDYESMAVMQYNVAVSSQALGNTVEALSALDAAIAVDREFGLRTDAEDNYALLLKWRNEPGGAEQVAQRMRDFPNRSTTLKFDWTAGDSQITMSRSHASLIDGKGIHGQDSHVFERRIEATGLDWAVSYTPQRETWIGVCGPANLPVPAVRREYSAPPFCASRPLRSRPLESSRPRPISPPSQCRSGRRRRRRSVPRLPKVRAPPALLADALRSLQTVFTPDVIATEMNEAYSLGTAMWIGATLSQGVHYSLTTPLSLPGFPQDVVEQTVDFVFTREVPCTAAETARSCVELVVRATPKEDTLEKVLARHHLPQSAALHYSSSLSMRLVIEPRTLQTYLRDTRRYWYATLGKRVPSGVMMESDHTQIATTYR